MARFPCIGSTGVRPHKEHDVQLYYYYAIRCYQLEWCLEDTSNLVLKSQNQILIAYYLKDGLFSEEQINSLKLLDNEKFWFQNYHLILYRPELIADLDGSVTKYLLPEKALAQIKDRRYEEYLKNDGRNNILFYGLAFCKKRCKVIVESRGIFMMS